MICRAILAAGWLLAVLPAGPARADGRFPNDLAPADRTRLSGAAENRARAVEEARRDGASIDLGVLDRLLEGEAVTLAPTDLAGPWQCRAIKLGGTLPITVHGWFRCRITDDLAGLRLEKLGGSQRTSGTFYDLGEARLGYAGAEAWGDEAPRRYGDDPQRDQVGYLVPLSRDRLRLELPEPRQESRFDLMEFRRVK